MVTQSWLDVCVKLPGIGCWAATMLTPHDLRLEDIGRRCPTRDPKLIGPNSVAVIVAGAPMLWAGEEDYWWQIESLHW